MRFVRVVFVLLLSSCTVSTLTLNDQGSDGAPMGQGRTDASSKGTDAAGDGNPTVPNGDPDGSDASASDGAATDAGKPMVDPLPTTGIALGAYIHMREGNLYAPGSVKAMDDFAKLVGGMPRIIMWYQDFVHFAEFQRNEMRNVAVRGAIPMVTWEPWDSSAGAGQAKYRLSNITRGDFDAFIERWARAARDYQQVFYLRFAHEMNGNWYPWGTGASNPNKNSTTDYRNAWRHIHDIFKRVGATNVRWVFSPNIGYPGSTGYSAQYPGDAYVDLVALDGYNWGTTKLLGTWQSLEQVFQSSYRELTALTQKPLLIAETASTEQGGNKASWIRQGFLQTMQSRFPRVRGVVWFHQLKETDWRVDSSSPALQAFREVVKSPLYRLAEPPSP